MINCPLGMEYQQCGHLCSQTCNSETSNCYSGCSEGCFCLNNEVLLDGVCTDKINCPGKSRDCIILHNDINYTICKL